MTKTLLDAEYVVRGNGAVVRLFYRTKDGRTVEEVTDFKPYFYVVPHGDAKKAADAIKGLANVMEVDVRNMKYGGEEVSVLHVVTRLPSDVPQVRDAAQKLPEVKSIHEAHVPFVRRFLTDSKLIPMEHADEMNLTVAAVDIEVYNPQGEPHAERDPILMISYADSKGYQKVWSLKNKTNTKLNIPYVEIVDDEKTLLSRLVSAVKEHEVDVIVGYNSDNFDFPYLKERSERLKVPLTLGVEDNVVKTERRGMNMGARILGRPHVDLYPVCRQTFNLPRYRLEDVFEALFDEEKLEVDSVHMAAIWDSPNPADYEALAAYSLSDVVSTLRIAQHVLPLQYELARVIREPLYESSRMASGQRVEQLLINEAHERSILVPSRPGGDEYAERQDQQITGGFVLEPEKGLHDTLLIFDFRSLYPSIIISHNVDPDTLVKKPPEDDDSLHYAPNGVAFRKTPRGFIPQVIETLLVRRQETKAAMKKETDPQKKAIFDVKQTALKLLANSMYGYYGYARARWYNRDCADAITHYGRDYIHKTMRGAQEHGFKVIYGDTDSIFITKEKVEDRETVVKEAKAFAKDINSKLPSTMELDYQGFYPRGVFVSKKRYALITEEGKLVIKGLETKRRDWADVAKKTQEKVLDALLRDRDPEKAARIVREVVEDIKAGKMKLSDLAIHSQITRNFGEYVSPGPHIAAAKKAMKQGYDFKQGAIISYIVCKRAEHLAGDTYAAGDDKISAKAKIIELAKEGEYDPDYYINNQVLPAVHRILEAFGYSEDELKGLGKQKTLGDYWG
ncbi:DNA polymerase [uncultured archaeon]|nr:DNA polymerase [uncultured archaeon]